MTGVYLFATLANFICLYSLQQNHLLSFTHTTEALSQNVSKKKPHPLTNVKHVEEKIATL